MKKLNFGIGSLCRGAQKMLIEGPSAQNGQIQYYKWSKVPPTYSHCSPVHTKVVYNFFGSKHLYFIVSKAQLPEVTGNMVQGTFSEGLKSLFGVSGVQLRSKTFLIKISSMAHQLTVFFGKKSIFEDLFYFFPLFRGSHGSFRGLQVPRRTKIMLNQTIENGT